MAHYERSHFEALLEKAYHPDSPDDKLFISQRVNEAFELYTGLLQEGVTQYAAYDLAVNVLFDGL